MLVNSKAVKHVQEQSKGQKEKPKPFMKRKVGEVGRWL